METSDLVFLILKIAIVILGIVCVSLVYFSATDLYQRTQFCKSIGGDGHYTCYLEENGKIVGHEMIKFKGKWRLA